MEFLNLSRPSVRKPLLAGRDRHARARWVDSKLVPNHVLHDSLRCAGLRPLRGRPHGKTQYVANPAARPRPKAAWLCGVQLRGAARGAQEARESVDRFATGPPCSLRRVFPGQRFIFPRSPAAHAIAIMSSVSAKAIAARAPSPPPEHCTQRQLDEIRRRPTIAAGRPYVGRGVASEGLLRAWDHRASSPRQQATERVPKASATPTAGVSDPSPRDALLSSHPIDRAAPPTALTSGRHRSHARSLRSLASCIVGITRGRSETHNP